MARASTVIGTPARRPYVQVRNRPGADHMRVFITGGSGYIGSTLVPALIAAGHEVSALERSDDGAAKLAGAGAIPVAGELSDVNVLRAGARAADGGIQLAPSSPDVALAASEAMQAELGDGPFVFTGGAWVYGD